MFYQVESGIVDKTRKNTPQRTDKGLMQAWIPEREQQFTVLNETEFLHDGHKHNSNDHSNTTTTIKLPALHHLGDGLP